MQPRVKFCLQETISTGYQPLLTSSLKTQTEDTRYAADCSHQHILSRLPTPSLLHWGVNSNMHSTIVRNRLSRVFNKSVSAIRPLDPTKILPLPIHAISLDVDYIGFFIGSCSLTSYFQYLIGSLDRRSFVILERCPLRRTPREQPRLVKHIRSFDMSTIAPFITPSRINWLIATILTATRRMPRGHPPRLIELQLLPSSK